MLTKKLILQLKYFKTKKSDLLEELHNKCYKPSIRTVGCTFRADLLYLILKKQNFKPIIVEYIIKNNKQISITNYEKEYNHICGKKFHKHFVVLLNNHIWDPNLSLKKPILKEDYEKYAIKYKPKEDILCIKKSNITHTASELRQYLKIYYTLSDRFKNLIDK